MKVLTCKNGHYFDTDAYPVCPHCGAEVGNGERPSAPAVNLGGQLITQSEVKKEKKGLFNKKKKEEEFGFVPVVPKMNVMERPAAPASVMTGSFQNDSGCTVSMWDNEQPVTQQPVVQPQAPQPMTQQPMTQQPVIQPQVQQPVTQQPMVQPQAPQPVTQQPMVQPQVQQPVVTATPAGNDLRTVMMFGSDVDPVTGWLVCIEGESYGESYTISSGRNTVGRGTDMDIAIVGEPSISREKQATIIFEPNKQKFIMQPGESGSLTYVNEELLLNFVELNAYDIIQMGNAKFVFLPLCGEKFNWKDYPDND